MLRILRFILTGDWHLHKWEDAGEVHDFHWYKNPKPYKKIQPMKCTICGKRKSFEL